MAEWAITVRLPLEGKLAAKPTDEVAAEGGNMSEWVSFCGGMGASRPANINFTAVPYGRGTPLPYVEIFTFI